MTRHIHDCTGPEMTCSCGYSTDKRRKPTDVIADIVSCAGDEDGNCLDAETFAKEIYVLGFLAGQQSIAAPSAIRSELMAPYKCLDCSWYGQQTELIQAGLNYELCPKCEGTTFKIEEEPTPPSQGETS